MSVFFFFSDDTRSVHSREHAVALPKRNQSIAFRVRGRWCSAWSLGPSGYLLSFALRFRQSGPSIERLDFNQRPLLIAVRGPRAQLALYADETSLFVAGPRDKRPAPRRPPLLVAVLGTWIWLQVVTDARTGPAPPR